MSSHRESRSPIPSTLFRPGAGAPPAEAGPPPQLSIPGTRQERLKVWFLVSVTVTDSSPGSFGV